MLHQRSGNASPSTHAGEAATVPLLPACPALTELVAAPRRARRRRTGALHNSRLGRSRDMNAVADFFSTVIAHQHAFNMNEGFERLQLER